MFSHVLSATPTSKGIWNMPLNLIQLRISYATHEVKCAASSVPFQSRFNLPLTHYGSTGNNKRGRWWAYGAWPVQGLAQACIIKQKYAITHKNEVLANYWIRVLIHAHPATHKALLWAAPLVRIPPRGKLPAKGKNDYNSDNDESQKVWCS